MLTQQHALKEEHHDITTAYESGKQNQGSDNETKTENNIGPKLWNRKKEVEQRLGIGLRGGRAFSKLEGGRNSSPNKAPVSKKGERQ
ncbi:hypothetical protein DEO72_LG11g2989 [Vigna unguiculata]|uniref:Uncharacterized protein n=1 Tax=Vigna unguiculata TaxID=3917 RepID=A0A4D6NQS2_VIGUN|nr:hypothetical protein DEO72_LG11g2989 [Vigna unguiculata]